MTTWCSRMEWSERLLDDYWLEILRQDNVWCEHKDETFATRLPNYWLTNLNAQDERNICQRNKSSSSRSTDRRTCQMIFLHTSTPQPPSQVPRWAQQVLFSPKTVRFEACRTFDVHPTSSSFHVVIISSLRTWNGHVSSWPNLIDPTTRVANHKQLLLAQKPPVSDACQLLAIWLLEFSSRSKIRLSQSLTNPLTKRTKR